jgi:hypothetical protein
MDKTPPRAGHPLDGAASRKVTGDAHRSLLVAHLPQEYQSKEPSAFQLIARSFHTGVRDAKSMVSPVIPIPEESVRNQFRAVSTPPEKLRAVKLQSQQLPA